MSGYILNGRISVPKFSDYEIERREHEKAREARKAAAFKVWMDGGTREAFEADCDAGWAEYHAACRASKACRTV